MENWLGEVRRLNISKFKNVFTFKTKSSLSQQRDYVCTVHSMNTEKICQQQFESDLLFQVQFLRNCQQW